MFGIQQIREGALLDCSCIRIGRQVVYRFPELDQALDHRIRGLVPHEGLQTVALTISARCFHGTPLEDVLG